MFLNYFYILISKINFKKLKKYIILMHFQAKNNLKNNFHYITKQNTSTFIDHRLVKTICF